MVFNVLKKKQRTSVARTAFQFQYLDLMLEIIGSLCPLFPVRGESTSHVSVFTHFFKNFFFNQGRDFLALVHAELF